MGAGVPTYIKAIALNRAASDEGDDADHETDDRFPESSPDNEPNQAKARRIYQPYLPIGLRPV
jgi:hypothetical protein